MASKEISLKITVDGKELDLAKTSVEQFEKAYSAAAQKLSTLKVGTDPSGAYSDMNCSEVIVYGISQAANRTAINTAINSYYLIY